MIIEWVLWGLVWLWLFLWPLSRVSLGLPKFTGGQTLDNQDPDDIEREYQTRRRIRLVSRLSMLIHVVVTLCFALSMAGQPPAMDSLPLLLTACASVVLGLLVMTVLRLKIEQGLVEAEPRLKEGLVSPWTRFVPILMIILLVGLPASVGFDSDWFLVMLAAAVLISVVAQRVMLRRMIKNRLVLPDDSPLAIRIQEVVQQFGFQPKRIIVLRTLLANAMAMPDGTVWVSTTLKEVLNADEVAAVLAHELSHAKDRDAQKFQRMMFALYLVVVAIEAAIVVGLVVLDVPKDWWILSFVSTMIFTINLCVAPYTAYTRRKEFKCDAAAVRTCGAETMISALTKLSRTLRLPAQWDRFDALFLTHPSLVDRAAAMRKLQETEGRTMPPPIVP